MLRIRPIDLLALFMQNILSLEADLNFYLQLFNNHLRTSNGLGN